MANCTYPNCGITLAWTEEPDDSIRESLFCTKHIDAKCNYPPCQNKVRKGADTCEECFAFIQHFDWIHSVRHTQFTQRAMEAQRAQAISKRLVSANGKPLDLKLGR